MGTLSLCSKQATRFDQDYVKLGEKIGKGEFGVVYKCRNVIDN